METAWRDVPRQKRAILEGYLRLLGGADGDMREKITCYAQSLLEDDRPSVRKAARRVHRALGQS